MGRLTGYWYRGEGGLNFGDALVPLLFRRLAGLTLEWAPPPDADVFAIGSNVELIPPGFRGVIFGTGIADPATYRRDLVGATILAVRGNLTRACIGAGDVLLADPGLLAGELLEERPEADIEHGFVRHFADHRPVAGHQVDVLGGPDHVIAAVARCRRITTSSLHGLILADALGIPSRWSPHRSTQATKFEDYASSFGEQIRPHVWRQADPAAVADKVHALVLALATIAPQPVQRPTLGDRLRGDIFSSSPLEAAL